MAADAAIQGNEATVWTNPQGEPTHFIWDRRRFRVTARPIPWIDRTNWWTTSPRVPPGKASEVFERRMWQVEGTADDDGQILLFDFIAGPNQRWPVTAIYD